MGKKYKRLLFEERVKIQILFEEGNNKSYFARKLNRNRSTIKREIDKWE